MAREQEYRREGYPQSESAKPAGAWAVALSAQDLITLNEEIAGMARAGLPLDQGLAVLAREMGRGRLQHVTASLAKDLQAGHSLADALERQGGRVPPFYGALVAAGVRTGRIGEVLATMTVYARTLADLTSTVVSALFYPAIVFVLALVMFGFIFYYLVPQFEQIYNDFRLKLPLLTEVVFALSHRPIFLVLVPGLLVGMVFGTWLVLSRFEKGRVAWARWFYMVPIVGTMVRSARLAAFTDLLGILVDHKVPLPEGFQLAGQACSDPILAAGAQEVTASLSQGKPLGETLRGNRLVPALVAWMVALGEKRGNLGLTLHQVAAMYRRQVEMRAAFLRAVLPTILVIVTAALVFVLFMMALLGPMAALIDGMAGGKM
jgi:type II secretory pathway component PulF